jgi:selenophosphate synthetase-related protein
VADHPTHISGAPAPIVAASDEIARLSLRELRTRISELEIDLLGGGMPPPVQKKLKMQVVLLKAQERRLLEGSG